MFRANISILHCIVKNATNVQYGITFFQESFVFKHLVS
jgi:hypothetical protein